jgi:hypothetical protein
MLASENRFTETGVQRQPPLLIDEFQRWSASINDFFRGGHLSGGCLTIYGAISRRARLSEMLSPKIIFVGVSTIIHCVSHSAFSFIIVPNAQVAN